MARVTVREKTLKWVPLAVALGRQCFCWTAKVTGESKPTPAALDDTAMFESTIDLFERCYRHLDSSNAVGFKKDLGCEVRERLQQLDFTVKRVGKLEGIASGALTRCQVAFQAHLDSLKEKGIPHNKSPQPPDTMLTREESDTHHSAIFEMKLLTETFYYFCQSNSDNLEESTSSVAGSDRF